MSANVLESTSVSVTGTATDIVRAIREAAAILESTGAVTADYVEYMLAREISMSTYMGNFLAIPHGTNEGKDSITESALSFVRYDTPIDWDGNEVSFVVGIAGKDNGHLEILSRIAIIFSDEEEVAKLLAADSVEAIFALLAEVNE
jgi:PTS system mannitol-specific IIA component